MAGRPPELIDAAVRSPRYAQVYATLRSWIYQGTHKPGSRLPTEEEIGRMFGVSRITTRKAIAMLAEEGLVSAQPGRGTFVVDDLADAPVVGEMERLLRKTERLSRNTRIANSSIVELEADPESARDLQLPPHGRIQRASHLRLLDDKPIGYVNTDIPSSLSFRFKLSELNESPMLTLLERKGVDIAYADQIISATLADARLASLLNVTVGAPLIQIRLVVFNSNRRPVERMLAWYRADHYHHHVRLTRNAR
jgi:GntR family transcriptional regulator